MLRKHSSAVAISWESWEGGMRISCYNAQFIFANDLVFCVCWVSMLKNTKYGGFQCTSLISHGNTSSLHQNFMNTAENSWFLQPGIRLVFLTIFTLIHYISIYYYENFVLDTFRKVFYIIIGIQIAIIHKIIAYKHGRPFLRFFRHCQQSLTECQQLTKWTLW